jgi:putative endonuclease
MFWVYSLYSPALNKIYIGYSSDVAARLQSHNSPKNKSWTAAFQPWALIYTEKCTTKKDALKREKELKSFRGRGFIRSLISE